MDSSVNKVKSSPSSVERSVKSTSERQESTNELKEVKDLGRTVVESINFQESVESAETSDRVAEDVGQVSDKDLGTGATAQGFDPSQIKIQLLKDLPKEDVMRRQIEREIKKEINYLHKKAMKMLRSPREINYFEMSNMMRKIRELRGILLGLVKASFDSLKTLWLRYVHGVM